MRLLTKVALVSCLLGFTLTSVATTINPDGPGVGEWTSDFLEAREFAKSQGTFYLINLGRTSGCAYCDGTAISLYSNPSFYEWSRTKGIPLVYADYNKGEGDPLVGEVRRRYPEVVNFPSVIIVDGRDSVTKHGFFLNITGGRYNGVTLTPFNEQTFVSMVDGFLNHRDDIRSKATPLFATATSQSERLCNQYGENSLDAKYYAASKRSHLFSDTNDWFCVTNVVKDKWYQFKATEVRDPANIGSVVFYSGKTSTNIVHTVALNQFAQDGYLYQATNSGILYLQFTRVANVVTAAVAYTLNYQVVAKKEDAYGFTAPTVSIEDTNSVVTVAVFRTNQFDEAAQVAYTLEDGTAKAGTDYLQQGDGFVRFAAGDVTQHLSVAIINGLWRGDRAFSISLKSDGVPAAGWTNLAVIVTEVEPALDARDAGSSDDVSETATRLAVASGVWPLAGSLNAGDTQDWVALTNLVPGMRYRVSVANQAANVQNLTASLYTNAVVGAGAWRQVALTSTTSTNFLFTAADTNTVYLALTRAQALPGQPVGVRYALTVAEWPLPVVGFRTRQVGPLSVPDTLSLELVRTVQTDEVTRVTYRTFDGSARADTDYTAKTTTVEFAAADMTLPIEIDLLDKNTGWVGARDFTVELAPTPDFISNGTNSVAVVLASDPDVDDADSHDNVQETEHPLAFAAQNTSSGVRYLNKADTSDWFYFSPVTADMHYRFLITDYQVKGGAAPMADFFYQNGVPVPEASGLPLATLTTNRLVQFGASATNGVWLRISRAANETVYVRYTLNFREWIRPTVSFRASAVTVQDTDTAAEVMVLRTGNTEEPTTVHIRTEGLAGGEASADYTFEALPGATNRLFTIDLAPDTRNLWTGGRSFGVRLSADGAVEMGVTNATVTIQETDAQFDGRDGADGSLDGTRDAGEANAELHLAMARANQSVAGTLNGADTADWLVFTNLQAGLRYRVSLTNLVQEGAAASTARAVFYTNTTAWLEVPLSALQTNRLDFQASASGWLTVALVREADETSCVQYGLLYREVPRCALGFTSNAVTVSESARSVVLQVRCEAEDVLEGPVSATVSTRNGTATAGSDYAATNVTVTWGPADMSDKSVTLTLLNKDTLWEGAEAFFADLAVDPDTAQELEGLALTTVTLTEKDRPTVPQLSFAGIGAETNVFSSSTRIAAKEGDQLTFWLKRAGKNSGAVTSVLTWADGTLKLGQTNALWASMEEGLKRVEVQVPTKAGYQQARTVTLTLTSPNASVAGGASRASLNVTDEAFTQTLAAYAGDVTRVPFSAASAAWFGTGDEGTVLRCAPPVARNGSSVMTAKVTGPGTILFNADTTNATGNGCTFTVKAGLRTAQTVTNGANRVWVPAGLQTVTWTFKRGSTDASAGAYGWVSDIEWVSDDARETTGAFNGYAWRGEAESAVPEEYGLASLTVDAAGKLTGKLVFAVTNYAFDVTRRYSDQTQDGWYAATNLLAKASKGTNRVVLTLLVNPTNGCAELADDNGTFGARLYRNGWGDRPLSAARAGAVGIAAGYYTTALPQVNGAGDDDFGSGFLALTVASNDGTVKVAGKLADGKSGSSSSTLLLDAEGNVFTAVFTVPSGYMGGSFFGLAEFARPEADGPTVVRPLDGTALLWESRNPKATSEYGVGFKRETGLSGGWYDTVGNLYRYYGGMTLAVGTANEPTPVLISGTNRYESAWWAPDGLSLTPVTNRYGVMTGLAAPKAGLPVKVGADYDYKDVSNNTIGLTITLTRPTGLFRGSYKAWFDYGTTHTSRPVTFEGALTPEREDSDDGVEGRGFFLWADKRSYKNASNRDEAYPFDWSYDFLLLSAPVEPVDP